MKQQVTNLLVGHITEIVGPGNHLKDYLVKLPGRDTKVVFHPMIGSGLEKTTVDIYSSDGTEKKLREYSKSRGFLGQLLKDTLLTLFEIIKTPGKIDCYIGLNNFDTLPAIFFKKWKIRKVIYYGSDFADVRFGNKILNGIYKWVELIDLRYSDLVVSNTKRAEGRRRELGLTKSKSIVISNGVDLKIIPNVTRKPIYDFVFLGYLSETHGVLDLIHAFTKVIKKNKGTKLALIGYGPLEGKLKNIINYQGLNKNIILIGRLSHADSLRFLKEKCSVGIASYNKTEGWTTYASPLKVKEYLACGLPVIISDVPEVAEDVRSKKMGMVYSDKEDLKKCLEKFTEDKSLASYYSKNAISYINNFDWNLMFKKQLQKHLL